jgi:hypothetical protein
VITPPQSPHKIEKGKEKKKRIKRKGKEERNKKRGNK